MLIKIKNMKELLLLITGVSPQGYPLLDTQGGITSGFHKQRRIATMWSISLSFIFKRASLWELA